MYSPQPRKATNGPWSSRNIQNEASPPYSLRSAFLSSHARSCLSGCFLCWGTWQCWSYVPLVSLSHRWHPWTGMTWLRDVRDSLEPFCTGVKCHRDVLLCMVTFQDYCIIPAVSCCAVCLRGSSASTKSLQRDDGRQLVSQKNLALCRNGAGEARDIQQREHFISRNRTLWRDMLVWLSEIHTNNANWVWNGTLSILVCH